jgi:hypothetical protein
MTTWDASVSMCAPCPTFRHIVCWRLQESCSSVLVAVKASDSRLAASIQYVVEHAARSLWGTNFEAAFCIARHTSSIAASRCASCCARGPVKTCTLAVLSGLKQGAAAGSQQLCWSCVR